MTNLKVKFEDDTELILEPFDGLQKWQLIDATAYWLDTTHYAYFCITDPLPGQKLWLVVWVRGSDGKVSRRTRSPSRESPTAVRLVDEMAI